MKPTSNEIRRGTLLANDLNVDTDLMIACIQKYGNRTNNTWKKLCHQANQSGITNERFLIDCMTDNKEIGMTRRNNNGK